MFDGGIAVSNDVFIIQYKNKAEYIKLSYKSSKGGNNASNARSLKLWDDASQEKEVVMFEKTRERE